VRVATIVITFVALSATKEDFKGLLLECWDEGTCPTQVYRGSTIGLNNTNTKREEETVLGTSRLSTTDINRR